MDLNLSVEETDTDKCLYKCTDCERGYSTVRDLFAHQGTHTGEYPYICEYCRKGYKCKMNLVNHINLHTGEGYHCDKCKKVFSSAFLLKRHKRWHVKEKRIVCKICGKAFKIAEALRIHTRQVHNDNLYSCHHCCRKLCSNKALQAHIKLHSLQSVACPHCSRLYKSRLSLRQHLVMHESALHKLHTCYNCGGSFMTAKRLKRHIRLNHNQITKHECMYCGICVESQEVLRSHIAEHQKTKPATCRFCGGPLLRQHSHKRWGINKATISCPRCSEQFRYPSELLEHARFHGDDPTKLRWECELCGRYFLCRNQYEKHKDKPHSLTPGAITNSFTCNSCFKTFTNGSDLKEHVKVHIDEFKKDDAYLCHDCGKLCPTLFSMNYHRRRHVVTNLYPCLHCPNVFAALPQLRLHMKVHLACPGKHHCRQCDVPYRNKPSYVLHLKSHRQKGDGVCMKCLLAFPSEKLYAAHKRTHSLPYKCSKCGEQFCTMDVFKNHVKKGHCCAKLFLCGRCNLGLLNVKDLEQHEDNHAHEDEIDAETFRSKLFKNKKLVKDSIKNVIPALKTYCTCSICKHCHIIQKDVVDIMKNGKIAVASSSSTALSAQKNLNMFQSATLDKINEALSSLKCPKNPSVVPNSTCVPELAHAHGMPTTSRTQEIQSQLQNATVKKIVLTLPALKNSVVYPVKYELSNFAPNLVPYQNDSSALPTGISKSQTVGVITSGVEVIAYPCNTVVSPMEIVTYPSNNTVVPSTEIITYPGNNTVVPSTEIITYPVSTVVPSMETDNSTIVPNVIETASVISDKYEQQLPSTQDLPVLNLFCEIMTRILGQEPGQSLSYAIIENVKAFFESFLPGVKVNATEITTENTVLLFIQSIVHLFCEGNGELHIDCVLNDLDSMSLLQEMLRCMDVISCKNELEIITAVKNESLKI